MSYFQSKHINLRALETHDLELLYSIENDEQYWSLSNTIQPYSKDTLKAYLKHAHQDIYTAKQLRLVIEHNKEAIGLIDLFEFDPFNKRVGIGILIKPEFQNNGFASETITLIKQYCFKHLSLHQLFAHISTHNDKSLNLFKKNGFNITGTKQDWLRDNNNFTDVHFLQCINHD